MKFLVLELKIVEAKTAEEIAEEKDILTKRIHGIPELNPANEKEGGRSSDAELLRWLQDKILWQRHNPNVDKLLFLCDKETWEELSSPLKQENLI